MERIIATVRRLDPSRSLRTAALTAGALAGFAGNSLLCRLSLAKASIDPATFTAVRIVAGAMTLFVLVRAARLPKDARRSGSWASACALFGYAIAFSLAYVRLGAAVGALVLFGSVQATMIGWSISRGERPAPRQWIGIGVAVLGLVILTVPGLSAPDPLAAAAMVLAGVAWAIYTLRGRGSPHPLGATADNFARGVPFALLVVAVAYATGEMHTTPRGLLLACASGSIASGICYALWYAALRDLTAVRAAVLQLTVPVLAALGAVVLLDEPMTPRLLIASAAILSGIGLTLTREKRRT